MRMAVSPEKMAAASASGSTRSAGAALGAMPCFLLPEQEGGSVVWLWGTPAHASVCFANPE